jgi:hypothetical protein
MGEAGEGAEVFKNLFRGFSGSLSLFTNNPYQRKNTADVAVAPALSQPESNEKGSSKESLKKGKKRAGKVEESKEAEAEPIIRSAEKKNKKKNKRNEHVVESNDGVPDTKSKPQDVASQDINEGAKTGKKRSLVADETGGSNVIAEDAPSMVSPISLPKNSAA